MIGGFVNRRFTTVATSLALCLTFAANAAGATYTVGAPAAAGQDTAEEAIASKRVTEAPDVESARLAAVLGASAWRPCRSARPSPQPGRTRTAA